MTERIFVGICGFILLTALIFIVIIGKASRTCNMQYAVWR